MVSSWGGIHSRWLVLASKLTAAGFDLNEKDVTYQNAHSPSPTIRYYNLGVSSKDEVRVGYMRTHDHDHSLFKPDDAISKEVAGDRTDNRVIVSEKQFKIRSIDSLVREGVIPPPDFIKIDTEGHELEVLRGAENSLKNVLGIEAETSLSIIPPDTQPHFFELYYHLTKRRFGLYDHRYARVPLADLPCGLLNVQNGRIVQNEYGVISQQDVLYTHGLGTDDNPTIDRVLKLAIIFELYNLSDHAMALLKANVSVLGKEFPMNTAIDLLTPPMEGTVLSHAQYIEICELIKEGKKLDAATQLVVTNLIVN